VCVCVYVDVLRGVVLDSVELLLIFSNIFGDSSLPLFCPSCCVLVAVSGWDRLGRVGSFVCSDFIISILHYPVCSFFQYVLLFFSNVTCLS